MTLKFKHGWQYSELRQQWLCVTIPDIYQVSVLDDAERKAQVGAGLERQIEERNEMALRRALYDLPQQEFMAAIAQIKAAIPSSVAYTRGFRDGLNRLLVLADNLK